jgi:hypothetical protein
VLAHCSSITLTYNQRVVIACLIAHSGVASGYSSLRAKAAVDMVCCVVLIDHAGVVAHNTYIYWSNVYPCTVLC